MASKGKKTKHVIYIMSNLFPNLGRHGERLDKSPADVMVDGGVGADRVSMFSLPDPSGVGGVFHQVNFIPHKLTPPPAPGKGKKLEEVKKIKGI
jgi:hypothetical protein